MYDDIPLILTVGEAGKLLHIGRNRMYEMVHSGRIRHIQNGKRILIPRNAVIDFLTSCSKD
ncbi:helix-turn-helix domain-containing protein [Pseudoflavonifractor phocaeensis]|uniref:helix-turn-helix domain-containing protein n=1 Tax=Pseudoflavonifractor phocaeensis TaxID=1870988 RepID=UPI00195EF04B|nr:helix-turn-helix domain-containing protein [Pseudoflavonifractor phocaeensis]MBM6885900.1 helix-turn-helix domain-containing protein [Pseudoflavonifractor phocaeensis]